MKVTITGGWKTWWEKEKCGLPAFSPFSTDVFKGLLLLGR